EFSGFAGEFSGFAGEFSGFAGVVGFCVVPPGVFPLPAVCPPSR
ncbi:17597_t:CDS:1, partial [Gigaspora margarita]